METSGPLYHIFRCLRHVLTLVSITFSGAYANLRGFYRITAGLRLLFAVIIFNQWGLEGNAAVIIYECCVSVAAAIAAST
jgi:hypothetical protein